MLPPPVTAPDPHLTYRPEIDGLRALAVMLVVLYHLDFAFPGGYVGVDVFFVISGFLITALLRKEIAGGTFTLAGFYERRVRRILPASVAMTAVVLLAGYWRLLPSDLEALSKSAVAHNLFAANLYFYQNATNYFGGAAASMPLLHTWSLGVEEQFYFVFPLLLLAARFAGRRRFGRVATAVILIGLLASLAWAVYSVPYYPLEGFFLLPARAWELLLGGGLASLPAWRGPRWLREVGSVLAVGLMLAPACLYGSATLFPGTAAVPPCVGAALFIWSCRGRASADEAYRQSLIGRVFSMRGPVFVGQISYSLYLWHWPILVFAAYWRFGSLSTSERLAVLAACFVAAILSWRLIETPFRKRTWLAGRWRLIGTVAGATAVLIVAAGLFVRTRGVPTRFGEKVVRIDDVRRERRSLAQHKVIDVLRDRLTRIGVKDDGPVDLLVWGDSHAAAALPAFDALCRQHNLRGRAATHSSMTPLVDYALDFAKASRPATVRYNGEVVKYVQRNRIKTVVLVNYWKRELENDPAELDAAIGRTIAALRAAGATVYVMLQVPGYTVPVPKALASEAVFGHELPGWRKTSNGFRAEQAVMHALAAKYEAADCHFIDPAEAFTTGEDKPLLVSAGGWPLYFDNHHVTRRTAQRVLGPWLDKTLFAPLVGR